MPKTVISVENLSKYYRLGVIGGATFREDFSRYWAKKLGRPDPYARIGHTDHGNRDGKHIWALRDVNLDAKEGEILGIIGRNGAGKSTLLKILSRITAPTSGRAVIRGRVGSLLEVGTGFHPELTGRENIYLNGTILGMTRAEVNRKLDEIVEFAGVKEFVDTPVKRYSSGMHVRLAFGVAAHLDPEVLIVDEVLAVGDVAFQRKCLGKLKDVTGQGRTVIFVSHNMGAIQSLCNRAVLLERGCLAIDGVVEDVVNRYMESQTENNAPDLALRADRKGSRHISFHSVSFEDGTGQTVTALKSGDAGAIIVNIARNHPRKLRNVKFSIGINSRFGQRLTLLSSSLVAQDFDVLPDEATCFVVRFDMLPLKHGQYSLTLFVSVNGLIADWVPDAINLNVEQGDFFGTGQIYPEGNGDFLMQHHISFGKNTA